ncbi:hypothetical protein HCN44_005730 [Aphidius gifuensis]|uniref:Rac GTPase-activating protein 1 n=1 Tax=Aphidius gifuensis TaxID=684658 RepID=A0A834XXI0_APHGI|nr:rac GTPase-activating protein 1-like [Aphidius gifuensis]KAF7992949.1 hypothetical protein HCN44_005730 [Aphidius gifuensis]
MSIIATFDELVQCTNALVDNSCETEFLKFVKSQEIVREKWLAAVVECEQLQKALEKSKNETIDLERKLFHARRLVDDEKKKRRIVEVQKKVLKSKIVMAHELLYAKSGKNITDETREKFQFLNTEINGIHDTIEIEISKERLSLINELENSTSSLLSNSSCYLKSDDDLDASLSFNQSYKKREWKEHIPSDNNSMKKRKLSASNNTESTVVKTHVEGPKKETNKSVDDVVSLEDKGQHIESSSCGSENDKNDNDDVNLLSTESKLDPSCHALKPKFMRGHNFKTVISTEICIPCGKKVQFLKGAVKCNDCKTVAHAECKNIVALPCVPVGNAISLRGANGTIADYTPLITPMIPSLVVHCINEIELRGMNEKDLYNDNNKTVMTDVKRLKKQFLKCKGVPDLSKINVTILSSTVREFFKSLREPLITICFAIDFVRASEMTNKKNSIAAFYYAISEMPQPNRDTLAFLILHLQRVLINQYNKLTKHKIAELFGPILIGYSKIKQSTLTSKMNETKTKILIIEHLLNIPSDYWAQYVQSNDNDDDNDIKKNNEITYSTESLFKRTLSKTFLNPSSRKNNYTFIKKS